MCYRIALVIRPKILYFLFLTIFIHPSFSAKYQSDIMTRLPSDVAGIQGLVLRITVPQVPRFLPTRAPVVVYMPGGFKSDGLSERVTELDQHGFIEIRFNFQGGGTGESRSGGGPYDYRGPESLVAARHRDSMFIV